MVSVPDYRGGDWLSLIEPLLLTFGGVFQLQTYVGYNAYLLSGCQLSGEKYPTAESIGITPCKVDGEGTAGRRES